MGGSLGKNPLYLSCLNLAYVRWLVRVQAWDGQQDVQQGVAGRVCGGERASPLRDHREGCRHHGLAGSWKPSSCCRESTVYVIAWGCHQQGHILCGPACTRNAFSYISSLCRGDDSDPEPFIMVLVMVMLLSIYLWCGRGIPPPRDRVSWHLVGGAT